MDGIKPIKKTNIADQVFEQMKNMIFSRRWAAGSKIPSENELASLFNVSRVTIRTAIQKLTALGLLESKVGEGTFVKKVTPSVYLNALVPALVLSPQDDREILEFRRGIETEIIRLAALRTTEEEINTLIQINANMNELKEKGEIKKYIDEDFKFHLEIAKAAKNRTFVDVWFILKDILYTHFTDMVNKGPDLGYSYHKEMIEAIKKRDPYQADYYVRRLIQRLLDELD